MGWTSSVEEISSPEKQPIQNPVRPRLVSAADIAFIFQKREGDMGSASAGWRVPFRGDYLDPSLSGRIQGAIDVRSAAAGVNGF